MYFQHMKKLLLVRHAKSDWNSPFLSDFHRPLNDRGKKDAPMMAERLLAKKIKIDAYISSPAKRAAKTAKIFAEVLGPGKEKVVYREDLYLADPSIFYKVIEKAYDDYETIAIFSHNEGITDFANQLTNTRVDNIPTCGIFAIRIFGRKWADFRTATKQFWFFDYPKLV